MTKESAQRLKKETMNAYGGKCTCCGETELDFLSIDHIFGGGRKHHKELGGGGEHLYRWLRDNNYPEGFQVLCHNCNMSKHFNGGKCIHQIKLEWLNR